MEEVRNVVRKSKARNRRGKLFTVCIHFPISLSLSLSLSRARLWLIYAHLRTHTFTSNIARDKLLASFLSLSLSVCVCARGFNAEEKEQKSDETFSPEFSFALSQLA